MSLWVDKYRPTTLEKLDFHPKLSKQLKQLVSSGDFPHLMIFGPPGAGKKTRVMCLLRELYGAGVEKLKVEHKTFKTPSDTKIELATIGSLYHIELNPSDAGNYDRIVIQEVLKEIASSQQLDTATQRPFKVVVLTEVDRLSKDAQHALRRTMEKYVATCRILLICNSTSKVIAPIRSRCLGIRLSAPSTAEITSVLQLVAKKEAIVLPGDFATKIAEASEGNLRKALLSLEACRVQQYPFSQSQSVQRADWEVYVAETAGRVLGEQSPARLLEVRGRLYELLSHCIPPEVIMKSLTSELLKSLSQDMQVETVHWAAFYEHRLQCGSKAIFHLEAFVAKFMSVFKRRALELRS